VRTIFFPGSLRSPAELRDVRPKGNLDANRRADWGSVIVLFKPPSHLPGVDSNYRIVSSRIVRIALKYLNSDRSLLQILNVSVKGIENYIREELPAAAAGAEWSALQDSFQFEENDLFSLLIERQGMGVSKFNLVTHCWIVHKADPTSRSTTIAKCQISKE
jgi:hypothetical protein